MSKRGFGIADKNEEHPGIGQEAVTKIVCVYLQMKKRGISAYGISITERRSTFDSAGAGFSSPINRMATRSASTSFLTFTTSCSLLLSTSKGFFILISPFGGGLKKLGNIAP